MTMPPFCIVNSGASRSFPDGDEFLSRAVGKAAVTVVIGADPIAGLRKAAASEVTLVELGQQCLGELTGESKGGEGGAIIGFSRYRLGNGAPSQLIELVIQPHTTDAAKAAAISLFEAAGFKVAVCADRPGRIVDRLIRPYFNAALERLDDGLATADDLDKAIKLGLGFKHGPIEWLEETGLADHDEVSRRLGEQLNDPWFKPARRAHVAAKRKPE
jgi:3-hydroxybutyryl-CoA dehydrogenase